MGLLTSCLLTLVLSTPPSPELHAPTDPLGATLAPYATVHPRLLADTERFKLLRRQVRTGKRARLFARIIKQAEQAASQEPPSAAPDRPQAFRECGDRLGLLALAYRLTDRDAFRSAAVGSMLAVAAWPRCPDDVDRPAGHILFNQAVAYDWLYSDLDDKTRQAVREALVRQGRALYQDAAHDRRARGDSYLHDRLWINAAALAACSLVVFEQSDESLEWLAWSRATFTRILESLRHDGAGLQNLPHCSYALQFLLQYLTLERDLLDTDRFNHPWLRRIGDYCLYALLPDGRSFADVGHSPAPNLPVSSAALRRLAGEYRLGRWQWLAEQLERTGAARPGWLDLLWYDPSVPPKGPQRLPLTRWFADLGLIFARTDWTDSALHLAFSCAPPPGHNALLVGANLGAHQVCPAANVLTLVRGPDHLLVRGRCPSLKHPHCHSPLLIDGVGQTDQGRTFVAGGQVLVEPKIVKVQSGSDYDWYVGDAASVYPASSGLTRFIRHVVLIRPDVVVLIDDLAAKRPVKFELLYRFDGELLEADRDYRLRSGATTATLHRWASVRLTERVHRPPPQTQPGSDPPARPTVLSLSTTDRLTEAVVIVAIVTHPDKPAQPPRISVGLAGRRVELSVLHAGWARTLSLRLDP